MCSILELIPTSNFEVNGKLENEEHSVSDKINVPRKDVRVAYCSGVNDYYHSHKCARFEYLIFLMALSVLALARVLFDCLVQIVYLRFAFGPGQSYFAVFRTGECYLCSKRRILNRLDHRNPSDRSEWMEF